MAHWNIINMIHYHTSLYQTENSNIYIRLPSHRQVYDDVISWTKQLYLKKDRDRYQEYTTSANYDWKIIKNCKMIMCRSVFS